MNINRIGTLIIASSFLMIEAGARYRIDGVQTVIFGRESVDIITYSDIMRPGLDGALRSLDDIKLERLLYQDAKAMKMLPDEEAIDRHLKMIQRENNLTSEQLNEVFKAAGYTYAEGREQFRIMTSVNQVIDFKIRSKLATVPEREVLAYFDANPIYEEASYKIERAFVPLSSTSNAAELRKQLEAHARHKKPFDGIEWSPPFWVSEEDLSEDKQFITQLEVDEVSMPVEIPGGFELFRLKEKREHRLQPLEKRYTDIANTLRKPRYEKLFEEYKKSLFESASILDFD